ncbi:helix-turn-helix domain-containing protein [Candidatus Galacturonibacter soehngenii]|uniref:MerR family transcriptional regulator n=1 Tax=Candidatus Galacturonatibacter soehngenii TaxID=2307010 RepID=A0A7V7UAL4_9FIRM|nr:helix-turn-helix domain-containing protein [Candidatus Galacturonibacter soehngenii]KAB1435818.1 MerR family transcriptional regulator [Candidatus Galacturonibacter soehngenii]
MDKRYMISDAAKLVDVETHVLRYWEEELELSILRNEMGHRYYTEGDINLFRNVKILKERGFQLKAVKALVPKLKDCNVDKLSEMLPLETELTYPVVENNHMVKDSENKTMEISTKMPSTNLSNDKMQQFQNIIKSIVSEALMENNYELGKEVGGRVSESVLKEMDYLMKVQDEREEERYKKLDELVRTHQKHRKEIAATAEGGKKKKKFRLL